MATEIGRSLSEIDSNIKQLNTSIKEAKTSASDLDKAIKLNPGNVDAVRQKYASLAQQLELTQQKSEALRQKQQALTQAYEAGEISESQYNTKLATVAKQLATCTTQEQQLTTALKNKDTALETAKMTSYGNSLDKLKTKTEALSKATTVLVTAFAALMVSAVNTGDELYDTATKYGTSVETLQEWSNRLTQAASDSEAYVDALSSIGTIQSAIVKNGGERYAELLAQLSLTTEDLADVSKADAFDMIFAALQQMDDETERATIAQGLFGDSGLDIATIAGLTTAELEELDEELYNAGIITTEQAAAADEAANSIALLKQSFSAAAAELLESLMPVLESLIRILEETVIPIIDKVATAFGNMTDSQQNTVVVLLVLVVLLPKLVSGISSVVKAIPALISGTTAQAAATGTLSAASTPLIPIFIAIAAVLMIVITIMSLFSKTAKETADNVNDLADSLSGIDELAESVNADVEQYTSSYSSTSNTQDINLNIDVDATGDTALTQDNADKVAEAVNREVLIDLINTELGGIVK